MQYANVTLEMVFKKLEGIERELEEISEDVHRVKPNYAEKLKEIEKGKTHSFKNLEEMEKHMDETS
ncbi:MAG: hypothetical protein Q8R15_03685 [Candidatus Micrarchaeota archaeon]|nr:hypothetical protein [Candidatus Micrarchaeota archaeon]